MILWKDLHLTESSSFVLKIVLMALETFPKPGLILEQRFLINASLSLNLSLYTTDIFENMIKAQFFP